MAFVEFGIAWFVALARDRYGFFLTSRLPNTTDATTGATALLLPAQNSNVFKFKFKLRVGFL